MSRGSKIFLTSVVSVAVLLLVNAFTTSGETKPAGATFAEGSILNLATADVQVVNTPPSNPDAAGAPIVLLHCYGCSTRWWDQLVPLLSENHRVVRIDLLGHGGSEKPSGGYEIEDQAALVASALTEMKVEGATVVGHSMGGLVATSLAETSSQLASRVVIINSPPASDISDLPLTARLATSPVLGQAIWRIRTDGLIRNGYESAFAEGFDVESAFEDPDQVVLDNRSMTFGSFDKANDASDAYLDLGTLPDRLTEALTPTLVIFGEQDQLLDPDASLDLFATIPGVQIARIADAGHSPNLETPDEIAPLILDFAPDAVVAPTNPKPAAPSGAKQGGGGASNGGASGSTGQGKQGAGQGKTKGKQGGGSPSSGKSGAGKGGGKNSKKSGSGKSGGTKQSAQPAGGGSGSGRTD